MDMNDFTIYKENNQIKSMGFNVKNTYANLGLPVFNGGGKTKENIFFNKIHDYSVPLPLFLLNKHFDNYDVDNANEIIKNENEINKIYLQKDNQNQLIDNLIKLSGPKSKTKKRHLKMKRFTRKKY